MYIELYDQYVEKLRAFQAYRVENEKTNNCIIEGIKKVAEKEISELNSRLKQSQSSMYSWADKLILEQNKLSKIPLWIRKLFGAV